MVIQTPTPTKPQAAAPPTFERVPQNCRFVQGGNAAFELKVKGNPRPTVIWTRRGAPIHVSEKYIVQYNEQTGESSLLITHLQKEDEGEYTCTASNQYGEAVCNVLIQTDGAPARVQQRKPQFQQHQHQQQVSMHQQFHQQHEIKTVTQQSYVGDHQTTTVQRHVTHTHSFESDGAPHYFTNGSTEDFKVDTFEYRLLREIEFREMKTKRHPGEVESETESTIQYDAGPTSPPQILQRMRNSKLLEGSDATFQAKLSGTPKPKLTWFKNGQRIIETQRYKMTYQDGVASLYIHMALPEDAGYYTLLAENSTGRVTCSAQLVIEAVGVRDDYHFIRSEHYDNVGISPKPSRTPTTFVSETPESEGAVKSLKPNFVKVPTDKEVTEGKMVRFDCRVTGRPYPEVLWYLNGIQVLDDHTHKLIVNEAGNHSLLITVASIKDAGTYTCVARNKGGEVSFQINLTVIEREQVLAPKFVERFQTMHVHEGEPVSLHCRAVGAPVPRMTWQKDGNQIFPSPSCAIETSGGSSALHIYHAHILDSAWYQCTAQNSVGSAATRARLFVDIDQHPQSEPWRLHLPRPTKVIAPEGSPEREIVWLRHVEQARYQQLRAPEEPKITSKPMFTHPIRNVTDIEEGDRAHFEGRLIPIGDPTMQIDWFFNGKPLPASSRFMTTYRFGYVALTILHVYSSDIGTYSCRAVNELGEDVTSASLTVVPRARIDVTSQHPESIEKIHALEEWDRYKRQESIEDAKQKPEFVQHLKNLTNLHEGQYAHLEAKLTPLSDPFMKIEWFFNGKPLTASSRITTIYSFGYVALNIMHLRVEDSGTYACRATNRAGEAISQATITITVRLSGVVTDTGIQEQQSYIEKTEQLESYMRSTRKEFTDEVVVDRLPEFKTPIKDNINIMESQTAHFEARLEPIGDPNLRVEWTKNGRPLDASSRITAFFNFGYVSLTIKTVQENDVGIYTCTATNKVGKATSTAKLSIITKSNIILDTQHPEGLEKIRHLEDYSRYTRKVMEETVVKQLPRFIVPLRGVDKVHEGKTAHFETRLEPQNDPTMQVEWFLNGKPLMSAHRFKTHFEFGYVALDILHVYPEDCGVFTVRATNSVGIATQTIELRVIAKSAIDTTSIHKAGLEKIQHLEDSHIYHSHYDIDEVSKTKPRFVVPLKDQPSLREGDHIHLECRLEPINDATMRVEWFFNGRPLTIGTRFKTLFDFGYVALDITHAYPEDSGEYTICATNHLGTAHTSSCVKIIGRQSIIYETQHPEGLEAIRILEDTSRYRRDVTEDTQITQMPSFTKPLHNIDSVEASNVHLECRLKPVGDPTMKVEWFVNGQPVKTGHRFRPAFDFDYVALDILSVYAEDSGVYSCKAVNSLGEAVTSSSVRIIAKKSIVLESQHPESLETIQHLEDTSRYHRETWAEEVVKIPPRFLTKFKDLDNLREGQNAHYECRLEPVTDPNLKVEWFKNGKSLTIGHRFRPIHDFGYVALDILGVVSEDSGMYTCRATNMVGSDEMVSRLICKGSSEVITETQNPEGLQKIQYLESSQRYYHEEIKEEVSTQPPVFTSSIQGIEIKEGQRAHFECRLIPVSDPNMKVEWFHNGAPVKSGSRFVETHNFGFVALDIMTAYSEDSGTYTCKATNPLGSAVTSANLKCHAKRSIYLETQNEQALSQIQHLEDASHYQRPGFVDELITQPPVFTQAMRDIRLIENQSAHFESRLIPVGDPRLKIEWFFNGRPLEAGNRIMTMHDFGYVALDLKYVRSEDSGTYTCKATNDLGSAVTSASLIVQGKSSLLLETQHPDGLEKIKYLEDTSRYQRHEFEDTAITMKPVFITPLTGLTQLNEGQSSHLECRVEPHNDPSLKIEWFFNGKPLQTGHRFRTIFDFGFVALDILHVYAEDSGEYMVRATNKLGVAVSTLIINVKAKGALILETQHPEGLEKIHLLEDDSRYRRPDYSEAPISEKPQFVRPLRNVDHVKEGQSVHLECTVTPINDPKLRVEWFCNGRPIPTAHRFKTTFDFGFVALDVLYAYSEDSGTYMCKATNDNGEAVTTCHVNVESSRSIYLDTLNEDGLRKIQQLEMTTLPPKEEIKIELQKPEFIVPLTSVSGLKEGEHLHLESRLIPVNDPNLRVEWYINGVELKKGHRFRMTHDFGYVALDILYSYAEDSGTYICKAVNQLGEAVTTCSVQIQSKRNIYLETQHPEGLAKIQELENQPKYQPFEVEDLPITAPLILSPLTGTTDLWEGQQCHLECRVTPIHDPQLTITFYHNGKQLDVGSRFHVTFDFGYVALDLAHVLPEDAGEYSVKAKNKLGEASSKISITVRAKSSIITDSQHPEGLEKIRVLEDADRYKKPDYEDVKTFQRPVFTVPLQNLDNLVENQPAHLECRLIPVGDPNLVVEWYFNEKRLELGSRFTTVHDFGYVALDIQYVRPDDCGVYMCRAHNKLGEAVTTASIKVKSKSSIIYDTQHPEGLEKIRQMEDFMAAIPPDAPDAIYERPIFTAALTGPNELMEGQPAHFTCRVIPVGDPNLKFEWYVNGIELKKGTRFIPNHDFGVVTLDISSVITEDSGIYTCKASNLVGEAVTSAPLKVRGRKGVLSDTFHEEGLMKLGKFEYDNAAIPADWVDAPSQPPVFINHLVNQDHIVEGENLHLEARVIPTNDEKLRIEWYKNGVMLTVGTRMRTMFDFGLVTLDISSARSDDSGIYICRAVNLVGEASSTCTIKVADKHWLIGHPQHPESIDKIRELEDNKAPPERFISEATFECPVFITHLNNVECREGDKVHFECRVEPAKDPTLTIEFYLNGKPLPLATRFTVNNDFGYITLDISHAVFPDDEGVFMCKASNTKGQAVTSGTLKIHGKSSVIRDTQHPMGERGFKAVQDVENAFLSKYLPTEYGDGTSMFPKPTFIVPLQANFVVNENEGLNLECRVEPKTDPNLTIEWFFNGKALVSATRFNLKYDFGEVTLDISDLWPRDSGIYTCRAKNLVGEAFTTTTINVRGKGVIYEETLHPKGQEGLETIQDLEESLRHVEGVLPDEEGHPPVFTSQFQNLTGLSEGDIAHFEASLTPAGDQTMVVEWFFKGQTLKAGHRVRTVHAFGMVVLEILGVYIEDSGEYTCRATNKWGRAEITVTLECVDLSGGQKPHFTTHIQSLMNLNEGNSAHFECHLIPVGDPLMKVEWFHNGKTLRDSSRIKTLSDFGFVVLDISFVHPEDSGEYVCRASNKYGEDYTKASIFCHGRGTLSFDTLQPQSLDKIALLEGAKYTSKAYVEGAPNQPPKYQTHISSLETLIEGQSAHFEATLTPVNDPNLKVEWYFNEKKLQHGHRFRTFHDFGIVILDILYCYEEDSGVYEARAVNRFGKDVTRATLKCKSKKSIIYDSQLPACLEKGLDKIQDLEDALYRSRQEITLERPKQAPVFTVPLKNIFDLREAENAHFEARLIPIDDPELKVEWFFNGKSIKTGSRIRTIHDFGFVVLEISPVYPEDSGEYSCRAKNAMGEAVTTCTMKCEGKRGVILESQLPQGMEAGVENIAKLEAYSDQAIGEMWMDVDESQPPQFLSQPADLTLVENSLAHFECRLIPVGDPSMKVEWYHNGKPLSSGSRIKSIHDFGFVILEVSGAYQRDAGLYTCKASNRHGEASVTCKLHIKGHLGVILDPQLPGEFRSGTESLQKLEDSLYRHDEALKDDESPRPPIFITEIQDLNINEGEPAHFECRVQPVGDPTMKIEWFHNGKPLETGSRIHTVDDFGFIVLDFDWTFPRDSGEFICRAMNRWGVATTKAQMICKGKRDIIMDSQLPMGITAENLKDLECPPLYRSPAEDVKLVPPKFITQIKSFDKLNEGDGVHFECRLVPVNDPKLRVEWFHNGKPLMSGHRFKTTHDFDYVALDILYVYAEDSGEYMARAVNDLGEDTTKGHLTCKSSMSIILYNQMPREMKKSEVVIQMEATLRKYTQEIHLGEDAIYDPDKKQPPKFVTQIQSRTDLKEMQPAKFECQLSPVGDPNMKVEWFFNGRPLSFKNRFNPIYDFGYVALDFQWVYPQDSGEYICRATNLYGMDETRAVLKSTGQPSIVYESQLPKEMVGGIKKLIAMEEAWSKVVEEEETTARERKQPQFVVRLEPVICTEGDWAKFAVSVLGFPRPRIMWLINGHAITSGSRYKLSYDGLYHMDIPKSRQYDTGKVEVIARNSLGEAYCSTTLEVRPKQDDYRAVLKRSPRPWYDTDLKVYQKDRRDVELERVFEEHLTEKESNIYHVEERSGEHRVTHIEKDDSELAEVFKKKRLESEAYYKNVGETIPADAKGVTIVQNMAKTYETQITSPPPKRKIVVTRKRDSQTVREVPDPSESVVHGKEVHTQKQTQTQKEVKGDLEITRKTTVTETVEQEHKGVTKERIVKGPVPETKPPVFTKKIQPCRAFEGGSARFECEFSGLPPPNITWFRENFAIQSSKDFQVTTDNKKSVLAIREVYMEDSGVFSVLAENRGGTAKSTSNLVVEERKDKRKGAAPPSFTVTAQDVSVKSGQLARLDAKVAGTKPMDVYWVKNGKKVLPDIRYKILEEDDIYTLLIIETFPEDIGTYECVAINQTGEARCQAQIHVEVPSPKLQRTKSKEQQDANVRPPSILQPLKNQTVNEGQAAMFQCRISAKPAPSITWYRGNNVIKQSRYFRMSQEDDTYTLTVSEAFPEDEGTYKCVAKNSAGEISVSAHLRVSVPESTVVSPTVAKMNDIRVREGQAGKFETEVTGTPTPNVQWFREGILIPQSTDFEISQEGTHCTLLISNTYVEDSGRYTCRATNPSGQAEASAFLRVESKR